MAENLRSIDDYECFLGETLERWSPKQRLAFAASIAQRWLPSYEAFSAAEQWGDAAALRRCLDALWQHLGGSVLRPADQARYSQQLHDSTPHMDDFDAPEALAVCVILTDAIACCDDDNLATAVRASLSAFEAAVPDWAFEPDEQPRLWKQIAARKELKQQLKLIEQIGGITCFDESTIQGLRQSLARPDAIGKTASKPKKTPQGLTNQDAFEQYRRMVESDLRGKSPLDLTNPLTAGILLFSEWLGRYSRRLDTLTGDFGKLADQAGVAALTARLRAQDAAVSELPDWDSDLTEMVAMSMQHLRSAKRVDVASVAASHAYGPSLKLLWSQARQKGLVHHQDAWNHIVAWARHCPAAWEAEDRRKKKGLAYTVPALGNHLATTVTWTAGDLDHPWTAQVAGATWRIRLNDFPDDLMYSLLIEAAPIGAFHDWPETWQR